MAKARPSSEDDGLRRLEQIKKLAIIAMFSEDELLKHLVLKGGNALDLVHKVSTRASVDIDFSMKNDFPGGDAEFNRLVDKALSDTFRAEGFYVFDVKMQEKPETVSEDVAGFWGGYGVEFKLVEQNVADELKGDLEHLRRRAINLGRGTKFLIDISKYEYIDGAEPHELDGYRIFVYSAQMMVCEKLRAICQQHPDYAAVIHRTRPGTARARDFVDIYALVDLFNIDLTTPATQELLKNIFHAKRVPLKLLGQIATQKDFHRTEFAAVEATVKAGVKLKTFDEYFDHVLGIVEKLKPLWNV